MSRPSRMGVVSEFCPFQKPLRSCMLRSRVGSGSFFGFGRQLASELVRCCASPSNVLYQKLVCCCLLRSLVGSHSLRLKPLTSGRAGYLLSPPVVQRYVDRANIPGQCSRGGGRPVSGFLPEGSLTNACAQRWAVELVRHYSVSAMDCSQVPPRNVL